VVARWVPKPPAFFFFFCFCFFAAEKRHTIFCFLFFFFTKMATGRAAMLSRELARMLKHPDDKSGEGMLPVMIVKQQLALEEVCVVL
jgi:hypothetical protein